LNIPSFYQRIRKKHRAGRRKKDRILRAQQRAALELLDSALPTRPVGRVTPIVQELPEPELRAPAVPLVDLTEDPTPILDLTEEETIPFNDNTTDSESEIEILNELPPAFSHLPDTPPARSPSTELEPLDPETEYGQNISRIFFDIDQYARSVFSDSLPAQLLS